MDTTDIVSFNIALFFVTTTGYWVLWQFLTGNAGPRARGFRRGDFHALWIIALLAMPININGNVWTVLGNAKAEKSMFAIASVYQEVGKNVFNSIGITRQHAPEGVAIHLIGIASQDGKEAVNVIGIVRQNTKLFSGQFLGVAYQTGLTAGQILGLAYQDVQDYSAQMIGVSFQHAGHVAENMLSIALVQRVPGKERAFAFWSTLKVNE